MNFRKIKLLLKRPIGSYAKIQIINRFIYSNIIRNKKVQLRKLRNPYKNFLNVGCGYFIAKDFINLDYKWLPGVDLCWDIRKGIPLQPNTIKGIYTEHCLEHISFSECKKTLKDFYRILQPKGVVRIVVPDAELYIDLYTKNKQGETINFPYVTDEDLDNDFTPIKAVNRIFRNHGHMFAYDFETINMMLKKENFINIEKESFMNGRVNKLLIDTERRKIESLYVEAEKPA